MMATTDLSNVDTLCSMFEAIGLEPKKAQETAKSQKLSSALRQVIQDATTDTSCSIPRSQGLLLYSLAATCTADALRWRSYLAKRVTDGSLTSETQLQAAIRFCDRLPPVVKNMDTKEFDTECGVGVKVSEEEMLESIRAVLAVYQSQMAEHGQSFNSSAPLKDLKALPKLRWADKKQLKDLFDKELQVAMEHAVRTGTGIESAGSLSSNESSATSIRFGGDVLKLHKPGENKQLNSELMRKHLEATGGKVVTRFPPEPNGYPHIGHAKAINFNFRYASAHGGICYLRYDDTNPEAEHEEYYQAIAEAIEWLGFKPYKVTHASDYFPQLYAYAVEMIKRDKAYVCHMSPEEIKTSRGGEDHNGPRYESPWRNRPIEESLREFERMRLGEYEEGKATLRLKQDMHSSNHFMWDLVAYRVVKNPPHCRTGSKWCIYPMYDFTHCLCDSLENITHSLCTKEFSLAREAYYWVCDQLEVYKAVQWEYGRLNVTHTVTSKRKVSALVKEDIVADWDDPRLYTLAALRRRGFPPQSINKFVEDCGITPAASTVDVRKLESFVRDELNRTTFRRMAVLEPLEVHLTNLEKAFEIILPNDPRDSTKGDSQLQVTQKVFIDASDYRDDSLEDPEYYRLTPGQPVGLFRAGVLSLTRAVKDDQGKILYLEGTLDTSDSAPKPKAFIQWVPADAIRAELRLYSHLFKHENPAECEDGWLADVNPDSKRTISNALVDPRLSLVKPEEKFQFQRVGYFCVDKDSFDSNGSILKPVFNLTVSIKEDPNKK